MNFSYRGQHHRYSLDRLLSPRRVRAKTEAHAEADRIRSEIRNGTFRSPGASPEGPVLGTLTLAQYDARHLTVERTATGQSLRNDRYKIAAIARLMLRLPTGRPRPFGDWAVLDITTDALEQFRAARRATGHVVATNRDLALLRAALNWAIRVGYLERTPFKRGTETVVKLAEEFARRRRLEPGEGERLLAECGPHPRALVEAALETGCRQGELLSLQWQQVRSEPRLELVLPAQKTKTKRDRRIPISRRLEAILDVRRNGPDGIKLPPTAYVFGNEVGQRVTTFKRAWQSAVLRAHGHKSEYAPRQVGGRRIRSGCLTPACRALFKAIDLHFHDLRREAGSRWLDGGVPLQTIRDWLGHSNISQTSTYLESTGAGQHDAMRAFDEWKAATRKNLAERAEEGVLRGNVTSSSGDEKAPAATERHH